MIEKNTKQLPLASLCIFTHVYMHTSHTHTQMETTLKMLKLKKDGLVVFGHFSMHLTCINYTVLLLGFLKIS